MSSYWCKDELFCNVHIPGLGKWAPFDCFRCLYKLEQKVRVTLK